MADVSKIVVILLPIGGNYHVPLICMFVLISFSFL